MNITNYCKLLILGVAMFAVSSCVEQKVNYNEVYDEFADKGQYNMPTQLWGENYWVLTQPEVKGEALIVEGLVNESVVGLMALAVNEGRGETMVWQDAKGAIYDRVRTMLPMIELGTLSVWELLEKEQTRDVVKGYVLYDINNHESVNVATVAAHVYEGVMIEKRDQSRIENLGYVMLRDVSNMDLDDSWSEFEDKCNKKALVLMPGYTSNQRSTAISQRMMAVHLNKVSYQPSEGSKRELLIDILMKLEPLSPVFGWEQEVTEDSFVKLVSSTGNFMIPYDWTVNTPFLWADYKSRQSGRTKVTDPTTINYGDAEHYMSFYMSDGDNVMWAMTGYDTDAYYNSPFTSQVKMSFGYPVANLSMMSPEQNAYLLDKQNPDATLMESLGGGYYYADEFAEMKDREAILDMAAKSVGTHMRQHRSKVLALVCNDVASDEAQRAYQSFIKNNDELVGIVVIQYTPYAGGEGEIFWYKNSSGYDIPVLTVRYSIWNYEGVNGQLEGTPAYIASKYENLTKGSEESTFSVTSVHAWSRFKRSDDPDDLLAEGESGGTIHGVESAVLCAERLTEKIKLVNTEELIWQLRMHKFPDQVKEILKQYKTK